MKRTILCLLVVLLLFGAAGCRGAAAEQTQLTVFAAASLTETLTEIAAQYEKTAPDVALTFTFDSSGTLASQIEAGAACDLFLSAAPKQMDRLQDQDLLLPDTRRDLLENKVALAVPAGNPAGIESFDDLAARLAAGRVLLAVGNADVPAGQYAQNIFDFYGLDEGEIAACLTYGSNVKEVTSQVSEAVVDCGVIYATDAFSAGLAVADTADAARCGRVLYPAAVLRDSAHAAAAAAFLDYLSDPEAAAVFSSVGFTPLQSPGA